MKVSRMKLAAGLLAAVIFLMYLGAVRHEDAVKASCDGYGDMILDGQTYTCAPAPKASGTSI